MNIVHEWSPILMRINAFKFHPAVTSFAACDITSVIHPELVFICFPQNRFKHNVARVEENMKQTTRKLLYARLTQLCSATKRMKSAEDCLG